jgi:mannosyltransferase
LCRWRTPLPLVVITAFGGALRFGWLDHQSYWFDDAVTVQLVHKSLAGMLEAIPSTESTPPLYYVLAWGWSRIFGTDEVGLRALSAVLGTATIPIAYAVGRFFVSRRTGLFAAALVACSPLLVWYSQEARSYALLAFLSVLSVLAFGHAVYRPTARSLSGWAAVSCLALATHYFAVFLVGTEALWLLLAHRRQLAVWAAVTVPAIAGAAIMPLALDQQNTGQTWWIGARPLPDRIGDALTQFVTGAYVPPHHAAAILAVVAVTVVAGGLAWLVDDRERAGTVVVTLLGGIAVLAPLALAQTRFDKFFYRNVIGGWPLLAIGLAAVLASRRARRFGPVLLAAACAVEIGALAAVVHRPALERDDWRSATRRLGRGDTPLAIVTDPSYQRAVIEVYRPEVHAMPRAGVSVREIAFLGFARLPLAFRPPMGFKFLEERRIQHIALVRYQATSPHIVRPARLAAGGGFSASGVLWSPH